MNFTQINQSLHPLTPLQPVLTWIQIQKISTMWVSWFALSFARYSFFLPSLQSTPLYGGRKASLCLDIIIVGCGLGGLTAAYCLGQAGHNVTVVEAASTLGEVGAGIQISPNVTRK